MSSFFRIFFQFLFLLLSINAQLQLNSTLPAQTSTSNATTTLSLPAPTAFPEGKCFKKNRPVPTLAPAPAPAKQAAKESSKQSAKKVSNPFKKSSSVQAIGSDSDGCIALQNQARAAVGVPPMHWDAELARTAQAWANHLYTYDLGMVHSSGQGQNLYKGSGECKGAFAAWVINEKPRYAVGAPIAKWGDFESYGKR